MGPNNAKKNLFPKLLIDRIVADFEDGIAGWQEAGFKFEGRYS